MGAERFILVLSTASFTRSIATVLSDGVSQPEIPLLRRRRSDRMEQYISDHRTRKFTPSIQMVLKDGHTQPVARSGHRQALMPTRVYTLAPMMVWSTP